MRLGRRKVAMDHDVLAKVMHSKKKKVVKKGMRGIITTKDNSSFRPIHLLTRF
jgi:hypothetical protein